MASFQSERSDAVDSAVAREAQVWVVLFIIEKHLVAVRHDSLFQWKSPTSCLIKAETGCYFCYAALLAVTVFWVFLPLLTVGAGGTHPWLCLRCSCP